MKEYDEQEFEVYDENAKEYMENESKYKEMGLSYSAKCDLEKKLGKMISACETEWDPIYKKSELDWDFFDGDEDKQWTIEAKNKRKGRPILTINKLPKFVKSIVGESKKNPPGIKLNPRSSEDKTKAQLGMGLVRYIEDCSGAKLTYNVALESCVIGGFGWFLHEVKDGKIIVKKVKDPFTWYMDAESEETDGSDANFFFNVKKERTRDKSKKKVLIYWRENEDSKDIYWANLEDGKIVEYGLWYTSIMPVFPVLGEDIMYKGVRNLKGVVRNLRDSQRVYNYMKSQETESVALTVKNGVMAEEGTLDGYEDQYIRAASTPVPILYYKKKNLDGEAANPPTFQTGSPDINWVPGVVSGADNDMRDVSGIYDTTLGADSKELSGKAIIAKQGASDSNQYTYTEHLQSSIRRSGESILALIPEVMAEDDMFMILGDDGKLTSIPAGEPYYDEKTGEYIDFDIAEFSEYDVSVASAPAYATRREAGADALQDIMKALPETATLLADLAVRNLDVPGAEEAAERLFNNLPDHIKNPPKEEEGMVTKQVADQLMQQSMQTISEQKKIMDSMQSKIFLLEETLKKNTSLELAMNQQDNSTKVFVEEMKINAKNNQQDKSIMADFQMQQDKIAADALQTVAKSTADMAKERTKQQGETVRAIVQNKPEAAPVQEKTTQFSFTGENFTK